VADTFEKTVATVVETKLGTAHPDLRGDARRGFQLLDMDDEERKAFGVYRLQLNAVKALIPVVYNQGEVDGFDILVLVPTGLYVPAVASWINMLMGSGTPNIEDFLPEQIKAQGPSGTHLPFHDFPYAMRTAETCSVFSTEEVETIRGMLTMRKSDIEHRTTRLPLYREFILSHPSAAEAVLRSASADPALEDALVSIYGSDFFDHVKTVSGDAPVEVDLLARRAETAPEKPGLFVVDDMAHPAAADLPEAAKKLLVKTGQFIVDRRAASDTTLVFNSPFGSYQSGPPPGNAGLVLISGVGPLPCKLYKYNRILKDVQDYSTVCAAPPMHKDRPAENPSTRIVDGAAIPGTRAYKEQNRTLVVSAGGEYVFDAPTMEIFHVPAANAPVTKGCPGEIKIKGGEKLGEISLAARIRDRDRERREKNSDNYTEAGPDRVNCTCLFLFPNHTCAEFVVEADNEGGEALYVGDQTVTVREFRNPQKTGNTIALPADTVVLLSSADRVYGGTDRKGAPGTPQELRRQLIDDAKFEELIIRRKASTFSVTGAVTRQSCTRNDAHRALVFDAAIQAPAASRMLSELKAGQTAEYLLRRPDMGADLLDTGIISHQALTEKQQRAIREAALASLEGGRREQYTEALNRLIDRSAASAPGGLQGIWGSLAKEARGRLQNALPDLFGQKPGAQAAPETGVAAPAAEPGETKMPEMPKPPKPPSAKEMPEPPKPPEMPTGIMGKPLKPGSRTADSGYGLPSRAAGVIMTELFRSEADDELAQLFSRHAEMEGTPEYTVTRSALLLQDSPEQVRRVTGERIMKHPDLSMGITVRLQGETRQAKDTIDEEFLEQLVRATDFREITGGDVKGLVKAMHQAGRLLLVFIRNKDKAEEKYGKEDAERLIDQLRNVFVDNGDAAIFLREKRGVDGTTMDEKMLDLLSVDMG